jgi:hypothetical protein
VVRQRQAAAAVVALARQHRPPARAARQQARELAPRRPRWPQRRTRLLDPRPTSSDRARERRARRRWKRLSWRATRRRPPPSPRPRRGASPRPTQAPCAALLSAAGPGPLGALLWAPLRLPRAAQRSAAQPRSGRDIDTSSLFVPCPRDRNAAPQPVSPSAARPRPIRRPLFREGDPSSEQGLEGYEAGRAREEAAVRRRLGGGRAGAVGGQERATVCA